MKRQLLSAFLLLNVLLTFSQELTVCTYNVRYKNSGDTEAGNGWNTRRSYLINLMNFQEPDLLGVQEAVKAQMNDILDGMQGYGYIGVGRNDGNESGEYSAIFYNKERMVLLDWGYFWLSDTPYVPSKGFPSKGGSTTYYRICTWGKFFHRASGTAVYHFNTHMDLDETNRQQSYFLIKRMIEEMGIKTAPVIVTGDYNAIQTGEAYKLFYNSGFLYDCYHRAKQKFMTNGTCPGFNAENYSSTGNELRRIDHIFITRAFNVEHYAVLNPCYYSTTGTATYQQRAYSDHSPVLAKLTLKSPDMTELDTSLPPVADGIYQISTAGELQAFSRLVGGLAGYEQDDAAKAVLTNDIDMDGVNDWQPIGTANAPFRGTFDGQGHAITGFYLKTYRGCGGLFGKMASASVQDFSIDGDITSHSGSGIGTVGWAEGSTISGVHSALRIAVPGVSSHIGGICGSMRAGSKIEGCSFSGTITDTAGSNDCIGGIAGYTNENCMLEDCANYGDISFTNAEAYAGGIIGYLNNTNFAGLRNCLGVGQVKLASGTPTYSGAIGGRIRNFNAGTFRNNYWLTGCADRVSGENAVEGEAVSAQRLLSGEICYRLNGDQTAIHWYQTLGEDDYPVLWDDHLGVLLRDGLYTNDDPNGIRDIEGFGESMDTEGLRDIKGLKIYNMAGQRLSKLQRGINIIEGKKIILK